MKKAYLIIAVILTAISFFAIKKYLPSPNGAPPYLIEDLEPPATDSYSWLKNWQRPNGPIKVGLQAGHWKNDELPDELDRLRGNTGSTGGGKTEWEVNLAIANTTKPLLEQRGVVVEILPATIPTQFLADVFVAIHADGSLDINVSGYKAASPRRDYSGKSASLLNSIITEYKSATNLSQDPNVSRNMRGYYAFAWWRYNHAIHPMTPAVILETGFLTSPSDRQLIVNKPQIAALGLANGILKFLESENLLNNDKN